ncbi:hypothetical protein ACFQ5D_16710 [Paenibacillus farraposensis]|uniref:Uncharacterized protein n=1 Tax=Paenibacillus farraposensis TaxID=2807095 RepID=A0ABW4DH39_9BACL
MKAPSVFSPQCGQKEAAINAASSIQYGQWHAQSGTYLLADESPGIADLKLSLNGC